MQPGEPEKKNVGSAGLTRIIEYTHRMKLAVIVGIVAAALIAGFLWLRQSRQQTCQVNLGMLYSAAVSYCLEQKLSPSEELPVEKLAAYVKHPATVCPLARVPYPSFSVLQGPRCPNGHPFKAGAERPLKVSAESKVAGLYREYGFTNLIETLPAR